MNRILIILTVIVSSAFTSFAQGGAKTNLLFNGFYIAKTGSVPAANLEILTYLRFYEDGTVYLQSVSSNDPPSVAKWFGRDKKFSQKGTYKIDGSSLSIRLNNKESEDIKLEGSVETTFTGSVKPDGQICLTRDKEPRENCFVFSKVQ